MNKYISINEYNLGERIAAAFQCGCERGENCTKTTVCANEIVVEDLQAEIERLTVEMAYLEHRCRFAEKRVDDLQGAYRAVERLNSDKSEFARCMLQSALAANIERLIDELKALEESDE